MSCGCIPIIDAKLAERNTRVMLPIMLGADQTARPMIVTDQIETGRGKKKAVGLFATFCPFCGVSYSAEAAMSAPSDQEPNCSECGDSGELFGHADDCDNDSCALNGDIDSCLGKVEPCYACNTPSDQEPVVVIGKDWSLLWASPDSLKAIVDRTGIKIGSKLYAHPAPSDQEGLVEELADALEDARNNGFGEAFFRIHVEELITRARQPGASA